MRKKSFYLLCDRVFFVLKIFRQWTGKKTDLPRISVYKTYMHSISSRKVFCWLNCMKRLIFPESRFMESWSSAWNIVTVVCLVFDLTHPFLGYRSRANSRPTTVSNPASHLSKRGDHKIKEISREPAAGSAVPLIKSSQHPQGGLCCDWQYQAVYGHILLCDHMRCARCRADHAPVWPQGQQPDADTHAGGTWIPRQPQPQPTGSLETRKLMEQ